MIKLKTVIGVVLVVMVISVASAMAKGDKEKNKCPWSSFGDTTSVIELISTFDVSQPYSGVAFTKKKLKFKDISILSTDYNVTDTDCGGGSPRFSIVFDSSTGICSIAGPSCSIFVYIGPFPNFTGCATGWQSTGNLITDPDKRFDTSQLTGGTFYDSYADALALAGPQKVLEIDLVVDGGWDFNPGGQDILVRNVMVNNYTLNANLEFCEGDKKD